MPETFTKQKEAARRSFWYGLVLLIGVLFIIIAGLIAVWQRPVIQKWAYVAVPLEQS